MLQFRDYRDDPIEQWTDDELDELAISEYDPRYLPPGMPYPENWPQLGQRARRVSTRITPIRIRRRR